MRKFILSFFILVATGSVLWADVITFEATVSSTRVSLDQALQLTLTFTGVGDNLSPISLPALDGFSVQSMATSINISNINGNSQSEKSFIYNLFPNKVGHFQIPAISATIAGQTYTTKPIDIEVFGSPAQSPTPASSGAQSVDQVPTVESLKDKIKIIVSVDKKDVYLNERIPLTIRLFVNDVPMRDIQYPQFDKNGVTVDDFENAQQGSQIVNGVKYDTIDFKTNIYPNRLGDLPLGPIQIQGNVLYKTTQNPINENFNPLGVDFLNNFTDSYATRSVTVTAQPIQLHVSSLPENNRPEDFSEAIGQFDFQASISPLQVKAGDPLTLKMDIKGIGNFKNLKMPVFKASGFKSYEPQIKGVGDEKTAEEVIIPTSAGIREVPALHFSYFDTSINDYKTITQGPFAIQVMAPSPDQDFKAVGFSDVSRESSTLYGSQFSFGKIFNKIYQVLRELCGSIWFWVSLGFIFAAAFSYFLWRRFQDRLENDPAFARRLKAVREARKSLFPAEEYISGDRSKEFYALLSKVLRDYLANKWHQSSAVLSVEVILGRLKSDKIDEAYISQVKNILEQSDMVCFAGANRDASQMRVDLSRVEELIVHFEKYLK